MDFFGKDKLSRLDEERQRKRQQRAEEALRRLEEVGKQTQQLVANHTTSTQTSAQHEATDASGRRPGGLSRVLFEQATNGGDRRRGKNKLDPRNLLTEGEKALAKIDGAMATIKGSVVDATGAGLRGGLEEASKSVTDIVDRVAAMASGTAGTLSPSANRNPLAEIMAEEQADEQRQHRDAREDETEDHRSKLTLENKLDTMKTIAQKATGLDLGEKRGGDDDESSFQFQAQLQGVLPHEAMNAVMQGASVNLREIAANAASHAIAGGDKAHGVMSAAGELGEKVGGKAGDMISNVASMFGGGGDKSNLGDMVTGAIHSMNPFGGFIDSAMDAAKTMTPGSIGGFVGNVVDQASQAVHGAAHMFDPMNVASIAMNAATMSPGNVISNAAHNVAHALDPANVVATVTEKLGSFDANAMISNIGNALDPANFAKMAGTLNPTNLVGIAGHAIENVTARLKDAADVLNPNSLKTEQLEHHDPASGQATGKRAHEPLMPSLQHPAGDPGSHQTAKPGEAAAHAGGTSAASATQTAKPGEAAANAATMKPSDVATKDPKAADAAKDSKVDAKAGEGTAKAAADAKGEVKADPKGVDAKGDGKHAEAGAAGATKKKDADDGKHAAKQGGEAAAKSHDPQAAKGAATATAHAGTATVAGEAAAKSAGAAAATANPTGAAAPPKAPQPAAHSAPQSSKPMHERAAAAQPTKTANSAGRNASPVSAGAGGATQINPQPVMSPAARDVAQNEKQVTQPNVTIEAKGESGALPGMPADLASQTPAQPPGAAAQPAQPAAPTSSAAQASNRTVAPLAPVTPQPTTAAKPNAPTNVTMPTAKGAPMAAGGAAGAAASPTPQAKATSGATQAGAQSVPATAKAAPPPPATKIPEQKATPGTAAPQTPSTQAPEPNIPPVKAPGGDGAPNPSGMVPQTANLSADRSNAQSQLTAEAQTQSKVGPEANSMKQSQVASQKPAFEQTKRSGDAPRQQAVTASTTQGQQAGEAGKQRGHAAGAAGTQQIQGQGQAATGERAQLQGQASANSSSVMQQTAPATMQAAAGPAQAAVAATAAAARAQQAIVNPSAVARAGQAGATPSTLPPFDGAKFGQIDQELAQPMPEMKTDAVDQSKQAAEQTYQQANTQIDQLANIQPPAINAPQSAGAGTKTKDGQPTRESAIANVEQQVTAQAQAQGPAKMQEAARPLQQEVKQHATSAQQSATTSADSQLQQHKAKEQQIKQQPPPTTGAQAAAAAQPQYQAHQAEATAASAQMKGEIATAQTSANTATQQAKTERDGQITAAQGQYQSQATAAQGQYTQAQQTAKGQFDSQNQAAQQAQVSEQQAAQQAAQQQTTAAQAKADSDIAQQNAQLNSQQQAANASHQQQMEAANQQHDAQVQAAQAQMDGDVASQQSQMSSQVSREQSRGQQEVDRHLQEGEQGYQREVQAGEQQAAAEKARADAEAAAKEREAQAAKDKEGGGIFGKVAGWVKDRFNDLMDAAKAVLAAARDMIVSIMEKARQAAIAVLNRARQAALAALSAVKSAIQGIISACASAIKSIISACANLVRTLIQGLANVLKSLVQALTTLLQTLVQAFQAACNALLDGLIAAVSLINKDLGDKLRSATQKYRDAFNNAMNGLQQNIKAAGQALQNTIQQAADGAKAVVNAAEQQLNAAVTRVEQTLNAVVETVYQAGAAAINKAFDAAEAVVNKAFEVAEAAVKAYFDAQIAALDLVQQGVNAVVDFVVAVADKVLEAVAKIAEAIVNMIPESWTKWFVDFWNGPWRTAIIIGLATVAAVAITVATCGAAGPVAMVLIAGLIGGTIAGTAYGAGELVAREGAIDLTENHPGEGVYVPGVGNVQIQIGPDGKPIPPANLTPEQQQAWEKNSQWALSNFNTQKDAEGNVTGYDRKSGSEIANYAVQEGIKGFGEGFISSAGAMGGSLAGGAVAGLGFVGRVASNPIARQMIAGVVEGGVGVVSQSVGAGWTAGFDAMAEGKSPGEAFSAAWKAGSDSITDPGNWVAGMASVGVIPLKTKAIAPLLDRATGRVANQAVKTVIHESVDVAVDTMAETIGNAGGGFTSAYYKAIQEGKSPSEAFEAGRTAANDAFKPEAIAQSLVMNAAGNRANKAAENYAARNPTTGNPNHDPVTSRMPDPTPDAVDNGHPAPPRGSAAADHSPGTHRQADGTPTPDNNPRTTRGGDESNPTPRTTDSDSTEVQRNRPAAGADTSPPVRHSSEVDQPTAAPIRERRDAAPIRERTDATPQKTDTAADTTHTDANPVRGQDGQPIKVEDATAPKTNEPTKTNEPQRFQDRQTDQARIDQQMADKGHSGIEVHSHFMGNVDPSNFAATIGRSGEAPMQTPNPKGETASQRVGDHSPYEPVMREIAKLNDFRHTTTEGPNGEQIITTRGRSGDALMQIDAAQQRIETLKSKLETEGDTMAPDRRRAIEQEIHDEARSAVEKALRASDETDFNSSYEVRDELVKKFYGAAERNDILGAAGVDPRTARMTDPKVVDAYTEHFQGRKEILERIPQAAEAQRRLDAGDFKDSKERKALQKQADSIKEQMAYDAYAKETLLRLAQDGITYTEQSNSINKIGARFDEGQIDWLKSQLIKEHPEHAQAIQDLTVKHVTMINTNQFGVRGDQHKGDGSQVKTGDLHDAAGTVRPSDGEFTDSVKQLVEQTRRGDVVGVDIAGAEHFTFDGEGQRRMTELYDALLHESNQPGGNKPIVLRPHVGEGANDVVPGQVGHRDANRQMVDGPDGPELSHYARAKENLDNMLKVFEEIAARPENNGKLPDGVIVRFGHATHTTPEMAARMAKLGIIAEVNLTSNIETGSVSQKKPADQAGGQDNVHTPEANPPKYELDPSKRGGSLDDHAFTSLIAADAPVILSTDAHSVMSTNMANEYNRAKTLIEEVRGGKRKVAIDESVIDPSKPPGTTRQLSYDEMPPHLKERFDNAERKLYEDANRYFDMRPKQDGDGGATPAAPKPTPEGPTPHERRIGSDDFEMANLAKSTNDPQQLAQRAKFNEKMAEAANNAMDQLRAGKSAEEVYQDITKWRASLESDPVKRAKLETAIADGDPNFDPFGTMPGKRDAGGLDTQESLQRAKTGEDIKARFDGVNGDTIQTKITLPDGTVVNGNKLHRGAAADEINARKGNKYGFDEGSEKFITETASPADQKVLHDAGIAEIDRLMAQKQQLATGTPEQRAKAMQEFADAAYMLFHGPVVNRGSDSTIRVMLTAAFTETFGHPPRLPQDIDIRAYSKDQTAFRQEFAQLLNDQHTTATTPTTKPKDGDGPPPPDAEQRRTTDETPERPPGKPIAPELQQKIEALREGESVDLGRRGGKDGLVEFLRNQDVEFGVFRDADGNYYVIKGGVDYLAPRSMTDRLVAHNHPGGTKRLSPDDIGYMQQSTNGKQKSTLLLTPGEEGGVQRHRVEDYSEYTQLNEGQPPIREVGDQPAALRKPQTDAETASAKQINSSTDLLRQKFGDRLANYDTTLVPPPDGKRVLQQSPSDALIGLPADVIPATGSGADALARLQSEGIPRWGGLTAKERGHETAFADHLEQNLPAAVAEYTSRSFDAKVGTHIFEVDAAKKLYEAYGPSKSPETPEQLDVRASANHAMHPAAVAIARVAFLSHLDTMSKLPDGDPRKSVFVTNGGCASGKGSLSNIVKDKNGGKFEFGAVWDAAGEGDAQENGWILQAAQARGLKVTYGMVESDPNVTYNGVLERADSTGRIVDPVTFARSYVRGQENMRAFLDSPEYKAALAKGDVDAVGVYTGRFDMKTKSFPDSHLLGDDGRIGAEHLGGPMDESAVTAKAIEVFEQFLAKRQAEGKATDHWFEGGAVNPLKFGDQPAPIRERPDVAPTATMPVLSPKRPKDVPTTVPGTRDEIRGFVRDRYKDVVGPQEAHPKRASPEYQSLIDELKTFKPGELGKPENKEKAKALLAKWTEISKTIEGGPDESGLRDLYNRVEKGDFPQWMEQIAHLPKQQQAELSHMYREELKAYVREMMTDSKSVEVLNLRDRAVYGSDKGPSFDSLFQKALKKHNGDVDLAYDEIVGSSQRSNKDVNSAITGSETGLKPKTDDDGKGPIRERKQPKAWPERPLTPADRAAVQAVQEKLATMQVKRVIDSSNPNQTQIGVAFDGTGNERGHMEHDTNATKLIDAMDSRTHYERGVATDGDMMDPFDFATGTGLQDRVNSAYDNLVKQVNEVKGGNPNAEVVLAITGFSRGAAGARVFVNELNRRGIPVLESQQRDGSFAQYHQTPKVGVMVLFDTVQMTAGRYDTSIPTNVDNVLHLTANDENRQHFPLTRATNPDRPNGNITEMGMPGSHGDIGGGFRDPYSKLSLDVARQYMERAGVKFKPGTNEPVDLNDPTLRLHDTGRLFGMDRREYDAPIRERAQTREPTPFNDSERAMLDELTQHNLDAYKHMTEAGLPDADQRAITPTSDPAEARRIMEALMGTDVVDGHRVPPGFEYQRAEGKLYRADNRPLEMVFAEGFQAQGTHNSLGLHMAGFDGQYVSFTKRQQFAHDWHEGGMADGAEKTGTTNGAVYVVRGEGVDIDNGVANGKSSKSQQSYVLQSEVAIDGGVKPSDVLGAWIVDPDAAGGHRFIPNPAAGGDMDTLATPKPAGHFIPETLDLRAGESAMRGDLAFSNGDHAGAEQHYRDVLEIDPNNMRAVWGLERIAAEHENRPPRPEVWSEAASAGSERIMAGIGESAPTPREISPLLRAKVDALKPGESVDLGRRGGKDGLVEYLRNQSVEYGVFKDRDGNYYVMMGDVDSLTPRDGSDLLIAHNHPGGTPRLSPDDVDYIHSSSGGRQRATLLLTPGEEGGIARHYVSDYQRLTPDADDTKGPIREVKPEDPTTTPDADAARPAKTNTLEAILAKAGKKPEDFAKASKWELESLATQLLTAKGITQPTASQKAETLFQMDKALKKGDLTFEAPFEAGALVKQDGVNERLGNIFGEKRVFGADELTHDRLKMSSTEAAALQGGFESGVAGQVRAASFINARHRSEGDFSHAYGADGWKNQLRAETYLNTIPKGSFVDGLSIEVMQEVNRLIHTPDTGMKAQMLRTLAFVGRGFKWDVGGEVREGKQYARPEHYSDAEIENLQEAGVRTKKFPLGMGHQLQYPDPDQVRPRMNQLIAELKTELAKPNADPIGAAAQFQRHFVALHPFGDSNGRTSRALMNRILLEFDMPPAIFADQNADMSLSPAEWRDEVAKGVARSKEYLGKSGRNSKDAYVGTITGTPLATPSPNKPITVDGLPFDLGADGFLYDPMGRPYMVQNNELIPMSQLEHYMMSRRIAAAGKTDAPTKLAATNESTRQYYDKIAGDPDAAKGTVVRDDARARSADQEYRLNPDPEVAAMLAKLTDTSGLDATKVFQFDVHSSWGTPGNGNGTRISAVMSKYTQMDLEFWYIEQGLRNSKQPELVEQVRANRAKLFEMAHAELLKTSDPSRVSPENPHGFRYKYEQMMHDTSPLRFASFDEAIHELGDKRMTVWRGDYSFSKLIGMAPNNDIRQPDAKAVADQRTKKNQITDLYDDLIKLEGSAVGRQYICTTSDLALLAGAFAADKKSQTVNLASLPAPIRERLLGWMDPHFPDGTSAEDKKKARQAALDKKEWVVPTEDGGKEIRDFAGIPGTILKMRVIDKNAGTVEIMAERKAFRIDLDKEAFLPGVYSLGGPSFEAEQELHGLESVRPWKIKSTTEASKLKEEFPVTTSTASPAPAASPSDGGGVGFASGEGAMGVGEGAINTPTLPSADTATPAATGAKVDVEAEWDAADGSGKTRTNVGVGERVFFTADAEGSWSATAGTKKGAGQQFIWTAPGAAGPATVTFTPTGGGAAVVKSLHVHAPTSVVMTKTSDDTFGSGTVGAGFVANVAFHPLNVSFAATQWKEDTGQKGESATGAFSVPKGKKKAPVSMPTHKANANWLGIGAGNSGPTDHAAFSFTGATFTDGGSFKWAIAQRWKLRSASAAGGLIETLDQTCVIDGAPHAGRTTVSKGGASSVRNPDGTGGGGGGESEGRARGEDEASEVQSEGVGYATDGPPTSLSAFGEGLSSEGATHQTESPGHEEVGRGVGEGEGLDAVGIGKANDAAPVGRTTPVFVNENRHKFLMAIFDHIQEMPLPHPHRRLFWTSQEEARRAIGRAIIDFANYNEAETLKQLMKLSYPANLYEQVSDARFGPSETRFDVALVRVAAAFDAPLRQSILRMGARVVVRIDELNTYPQPGDVTASSPLDGVIAAVLCERGKTVHTFNKRGAADDTGGKPFKSGAGNVRNFAWLGSRDPNLWNWIHVTEPTAGVTAEDVARVSSIFKSDATDSQQAYRIAVNAPYFGIPAEYARNIPAAWDRAPDAVKSKMTGVDHHGERVADPSVLGRSGVSDEAALADAPAASKNDLPIARAIDRTEGQLSFMSEQLKPWKASDELTGAIQFVARRKSDVMADPKSAQRFAPAMTAQERVLNAASSELAQVLDNITNSEVKIEDAVRVRSIANVVRAFARAAGVSHVADQATLALSEARYQNKLLPLALAEEKVRAARGAISGQRAAESEVGATRQDGSANSVASLTELEKRTAEMRSLAAQGKDLDPNAIEQMSIDASASELHARLLGLKTQTKTLLGRAGEVGLDNGRHPSGSWSVASICKLIVERVDQCLSRLDNFKRPMGQRTDKHQNPLDKDQSPLFSQREELRVVEYMISSFADGAHLNKKIVDGKVDKNDKDDFFTWAAGQVKDKELRNLITSIAIQVGVAMVTGNVMGAAGAAIRGLTLAGEIGAALRGTSLLYRGASIAIQAGVQTGTQAVMGADVTPGTFAENALGLILTSAAMKPFAAMMEGSAEVEKQIIRSWKDFAKASGKFVAELAIDAGAGISAAALARTIVHGGKLDMSNSEEWITQGLSFAANRFVHARAIKVQTRLSEWATSYVDKAKANALRSKLQDLQATTKNTEKTIKPEQAIEQLSTHHRLLLEEMNLVKPSDEFAKKTLATEIGKSAEATAEAALTIRLSALVQGHVFEGTPAQIKQAKEALKSAGITVYEGPNGRIKVGERVFVLQPTGKTAAQVKNAAKAAGSLGADVWPVSDNVFGAKPSKLETLHKEWSKKGQAGKLHYDEASNTTHFELTQPGKGTVRVQASLGVRVTSMAELGSLVNKVMGKPMAAAKGHEVIERLARGDTSDLTSLGIGGTGKFPREAEFGLGKLPDGRVVLVKGTRGEVDWGQLPGLEPVAHTHAPADLPTNAKNTRSAPLKELLADSKDPSVRREVVFPSGADFIVMAHHNIAGHVVYTDFVVRNGQVMRAPDGDTGPRLSFTIVKSREVGINGDGRRLYKSTIEVKPGGSEKSITTEVWVLQHNAGDSGHLYMSQPKGTMLRAPDANTPGSKRTAANEKTRVTTQTPGLYDSIDPSAAPHDVAINHKNEADVRAKVQRGEKAKLETSVTTTVGGKTLEGKISRTYDPATQTLEMSSAGIPEGFPRTVAHSKSLDPSNPSGGVPLFAYLQMQQLKVFGIKPGQLKHLRMSMVINPVTVIEVHVASHAKMVHPEKLTSADLMATHSSQYAETPLVQSGHQLVDVKLSGGDYFTISDILTDWTRNGYLTSVKKARELLAKHHIPESTRMLAGFELDMKLSPVADSK